MRADPTMASNPLRGTFDGRTSRGRRASLMPLTSLIRLTSLLRLANLIPLTRLLAAPKTTSTLRRGALVPIVVLLLSGCTSSTPFDAARMEAPVLHVGDSWTTQAAYHDPEGREAPTSQSRSVVHVGPYALGGTTYQAVQIESHSVSGSFELTVDTWVRASDLAVLAIRTRQGDGYTRVDANETFAEPCVQYQWPLKVGATWTVSCASVVTGHRHGEGDEVDAARSSRSVSNARVEWIGTVNGPAGSFLAARINITTETLRMLDGEDYVDHSTTVQEYAPAACADVHGWRSGDSAPLETTLTAYTCAQTKK